MYHIPLKYKDRVIMTEYRNRSISLCWLAWRLGADLVWLGISNSHPSERIGILFETPADCTMHILKYGNKLPGDEHASDR